MNVVVMSTSSVVAERLSQVNVVVNEHYLVPLKASQSVLRRVVTRFKH